MAGARVFGEALKRQKPEDQKFYVLEWGFETLNLNYT
jgi:hypothetical protein